MQPKLWQPQINLEPDVKREVTFWRDLKLLARHRDWGFNVPGEDIDFLELIQISI